MLDEQIPAFVARAADPAGPYDVGCLYIGVNDVRGPHWDADAFADGHARSVAFLSARCRRVVCVSPPRMLGRPATPPARVRALAGVVAANAADAGALLVDLADFGARNQLMVDRVHPTAFGQVAIARRVLAALAADGMTVRVDPARLIDPRRSRRSAVRGDWTYLYRDLKQRLSALRMWVIDARRR